MIVSKKITKSWKALLSAFNQEAVAKEIGLAPATISRTINQGRCSKETFEKINNFCLKQKEKENQLIEKLEA